MVETTLNNYIKMSDMNKNSNLPFGAEQKFKPDGKSDSYRIKDEPRNIEGRSSHPSHSTATVTFNIQANFYRSLPARLTKMRWPI